MNGYEPLLTIVNTRGYNYYYPNWESASAGEAEQPSPA